MTTFDHVLDGCSPVPLVGYLKALGVFRLVAEQADSDARGWWRNERFVLRTQLPQEELVRFFLDTYRPTPAVSPWNGGSGFYYRESKTKDRDPNTGKKLKTGIRDEATTATRTLDDLVQSTSARFERYRQVVHRVRDVLSSGDLREAPDETRKPDLIFELRSVAQDEALSWIDAAVVVSVDSREGSRRLTTLFPPLLGSGGNDGNLDFSTTLLQSLFSVVDPQTGRARSVAAVQLASALFAEVGRFNEGIAISQFAPGVVDSPNSGVGFGGASTGNPWDIVLGLEGTLVLSAAAVRRMEARGRGEVLLPFMVGRRGAFGAGGGSVIAADESTTRGEFWSPIWERPSEYQELLALFREGRAIVERRSAGNSLDFARALGQLGVDRGISYFERYAFEQRFGNMYLAVPLARHAVARNLNSDLIADLTKGGWLDKVRAKLRGKEASESLVSLRHRLDEALFRLAADSSYDAVQEALILIGEVAREVGRRPKLHDSIPPPPQLSSAWVSAADPRDGSHEFALAVAIASINATAIEKEERLRLPFRRHLAALRTIAVRGSWDNDSWDESTKSLALAVWTGRDLVRDLATVLERRLIEAQRHNFLDVDRDPPSKELPLKGGRPAPLASVSAFLAGDVDDRGVAALAAGLAWTRISGPGLVTTERQSPIPFAYAALKPLFEPGGVGPTRELRKIVNPLPLVRLLRAGRVKDAVSLGQYMARGAQCPTPFASLAPIALPDAARLAASLLFPISSMARDRLVGRAYPNLSNSEEEADAA
jgi:CRISPR-associated protein Csx17